MTVIAYHEIYPCFNKTLGAVPESIMLEREREWTCFVEAIINVQQVIVSNERDTADQAERTLQVGVFCDLRCIEW